MADTPPTNPVPPDYFERFVDGLEGIRKAVEMTNKILPDQFAKQAQELSDFYQQGYSSQASHSSQSTGASSPDPISDDQLRRVLVSLGGGGGRGGGSGIDDREAESGGYHRGGASTPPAGFTDLPSMMKNWKDQISPDHLERGALEIPRSEGAKFTSADFLNWAADTAKTTAGKRSQAAQITPEQEADFSQRWMNASGSEQDAIMEEIQQAQDRANKGGRVAGMAGSALGWAADQAPKAALFRQYFARAGIQTNASALSAGGAADLGESTGGGDVQVAGIGFRVPYANDAARAGISREFSIAKDRMQAGINGEQARMIYDQLNSKGLKPQSDQQVSDYSGWMQNFYSQITQGGGGFMRSTPRFDDMKNALVNLTKKHPELLNEQTVEAMDKATRQGGQSLKDFTHSMSQVSDVAKQTGVTFSQLQADMDAVGEAYQAHGGTYGAGSTAALQYQGITKMSPQNMTELMDNPIIQSQMAQSYGVMPWETGLLTGPEQAAGQSAAISRMMKMMSPLPSKTENLPGGFKHTISSADRGYALLSQRLGIPAENIKKMVENNDTVQARSTLYQATNDWYKSGEDRTKRLDPNNKEGGYGSLTDLMVKAGFTPKERQSVHNIGEGIDTHSVDKLLGKGSTEKLRGKILEQRRDRIQQIIDQKDEKVGAKNPNEILLKLDDKAKKKGWFFQTKEKARAGEVGINSAFGTGVTPSPSGDPYGSPLDPIKP